MQTIRLLPTLFPQAARLLLASALFSFALPSMAASKPVWLTIGDSAFAELQKLQPGTKAIASHSINNNQLATMAKPERVHLVQVDEEFLPTLSEALHHARRRCGGYAAYASLQQAKAALQSDAPLATFRTTRPSYLIQNEEVVEANLQQMRAANITAMISQLSTQFRTRYFSAEEGAEAADWLYRTWGKMAVARPDITVEKFKHSGWPQESVILTIAGSDNAREVVVLGAHLDSINTEKKNATDGEMERAHAPGADDDASGVAGITEALRALIHTGYKPRRTLKFIAYAAEEVGLRGSAEIAADFFAHKVNVVGALQLDMTNFKPDIKGIKDIYLISDYTDGQQNKFLKELIATYQPTLTVGFDECEHACSDHVSWDHFGYPASMPYESTLNDSNDKLHTTEDTLENSDEQGLHALKFAKLAASYAIELGSDGPGKLRPQDSEKTFSGSLAKGKQKVFGPFPVVAGGSLRAKTSGDSELHLYMKKGSKPARDDFDCDSEDSGDGEFCSVSFAAKGQGYVMLRAQTEGNYTLTVRYQAPKEVDQALSQKR